MAWKLIAEASPRMEELRDTLSAWDELYEEGERGILHLELSRELPGWVLSGLQSALDAAGVEQWQPVEQRDGRVYIYFIRRIAPLVIIAGIIAAGVLLLALLNRIGIWKWVVDAAKYAVSEILEPLSPLIYVALGLAGLLALFYVWRKTG